MYRLFLLDISFAVDTVDFCLTPAHNHVYMRDDENVYPLFAIGYVIVTSDLATPRTISISLQEPSHAIPLILFDVTPALDNNTITVSPALKTDDSATASTTDAVGTTHHGYYATSDTHLRHVGSGALGAGDTQRIYILYGAAEKCRVINNGTAALVTNNHHHLGILHKDHP